MRLGPDLLLDPAMALGREWLVSDGLGGWSAASVCGANTRREHGLLVARAAPGGPPHVLLSRLEETLELSGGRHELGTNQYPGTLYPRGFEHLLAFSLDPLPQWVFEPSPGTRLTRTLARPRGRPGLVLSWALEGPEPAWFELRPLLAGRAAAHLRALAPDAGCRASSSGFDLTLEIDGEPLPVCWRASDGEWQADLLRYRDFEYERDREAGRAFREDLLSPGRLRCRLRPGRPLHLLVWAGPIPPLAAAPALVDEERRRLRALRDGEGLLAELRQAGEAFLAEHDRKPGLQAVPGGRDDDPERWLRALPGLLGAPARFEAAGAILGRLLGRLHVEAEPSQVAPQLALLAPVAVARWLAAVGHPAPAAWRAPLLELVGVLAQGRLPGLVPSDNGLLLEARQPGARLSTQALWFNALLLGAELARAGGDLPRAAAWSTLAARVRDVVLRAFWDEARGRLRRSLAPGDDASLHPEVLDAVGLPHTLLPRERAQRLLEQVQRELLQPLGLREPGPDGREWLRPAWAGAYFEGLIRVAGEDGKRQARDWLREYAARTCEAGLVCAPEAWPTQPPHGPLGAPFDPWSTGELQHLAARVGRRR